MIQIPVIFNKLTTKVDHSIKLEFETREFSGEEIAVLLNHRGQEGWLLFSPTQRETWDVPEEEADTGMSQGKSPASRLRASLFILWTLKGKPTDTYEEYYRVQMERFIETVKARIPE